MYYRIIILSWRCQGKKSYFLVDLARRRGAARRLPAEITVELPGRKYVPRMDTERPFHRLDAGEGPPGRRPPGGRTQRRVDDPEALASVPVPEIEVRWHRQDGNVGAMGQGFVRDPGVAVVEDEKAVSETGLQEPQPCDIGATAEYRKDAARGWPALRRPFGRRHMMIPFARSTLSRGLIASRQRVAAAASPGAFGSGGDRRLPKSPRTSR